MLKSDFLLLTSLKSGSISNSSEHYQSFFVWLLIHRTVTLFDNAVITYFLVGLFVCRARSLPIQETAISAPIAGKTAHINVPAIELVKAT